MLTRHFLQQSARQLGVEPKRISDAALLQLSGFGFPGNVRQLENICHWLTVMAPAQVIEAKDLPPEVQGAARLASAPDPSITHAGPAAPGRPEAVVEATAEATVEALPGVSSWEAGLAAEAQALLASGGGEVWDVLVRRFESRLILAALAATHGRRIEAAQKLGIGRNTITRKIQELHLE